KLITVAAALEEKEVDIGTVIPDVADELELKPGACEDEDDDVYGCYRDFSNHDTMDMTVADIFAQSSNIGTIKIGEKLGQRRLVQYIEAFGLGTRTGVDYTAEAAGLLNFEAGCDICWASASIGYSVAATPLQMAAAYAAVGNDGMWISPHLVAAKADVDGETEVAAVTTRQVVSPTTARLMRDLLARAVDEGTGIQGSVENYRVGGKTGTANRLGDDGRYTDETRASFVGMAPISDPKVVVAVVIDNPSHEYRTGGLAAAPVFAQVMAGRASASRPGWASGSTVTTSCPSPSTPGRLPCASPVRWTRRCLRFASKTRDGPSAPSPPKCTVTRLTRWRWSASPGPTARPRSRTTWRPSPRPQGGTRGWWGPSAPVSRASASSWGTPRRRRPPFSVSSPACATRAAVW